MIPFQSRLRSAEGSLAAKESKLRGLVRRPRRRTVGRADESSEQHGQGEGERRELGTEVRPADFVLGELRGIKVGRVDRVEVDHG